MKLIIVICIYRYQNIIKMPYVYRGAIHSFARCVCRVHQESGMSGGEPTVSANVSHKLVWLLKQSPLAWLLVASSKVYSTVQLINQASSSMLCRVPAASTLVFIVGARHRASGRDFSALLSGAKSPSSAKCVAVQVPARHPGDIAARE